MRARLLSATDEPTITRLRKTAGGEVTPYSARDCGGRRSPGEIYLTVTSEMRAALSIAAVEADKASIDRADVQTIALYGGTAIGKIAVVARRVQRRG